MAVFNDKSKTNIRELYGKPLTVPILTEQQKEVNSLFKDVLNQALLDAQERERKVVVHIVNNVCDIISEYLDTIARGEQNIARDNAAEAFFKESQDAAEMARLFDDRASHTREIKDGIISTLKSKLK